jgi:hypothetical protein
MERGEWWLDDCGYETFADGDVGDANHEKIALEAALGLSDENEEDEEFYNAPPLTPAQVKKLRARGVDERALKFFSKRGADPRDYAVEFMGWVRVKGKNMEMFNLDDERLSNIQGADFWDEFDGDSEETVFVEERSTGQTWDIPMKVLLNQKTAAGLKAFMAGSGAFRGFGWVCKKGKCRRARGVRGTGRRL